MHRLVALTFVGLAACSTAALSSPDGGTTSSGGASGTSSSSSSAGSGGSTSGGTGGAGWEGGVPSPMIFWSGFEGSTAPLSVDPNDCWSNGCWQKMGGTDTMTGFTWPPTVSGGDGKYQLLTNPPASNPASASNVGGYMKNEIHAGEGRKGSNAMYQEIMQSGCCGTDKQGDGATQDPFQLLPASEIPELYISEWVKFQPDLFDKLAAGDGWRVLMEFKSSGDDNRLLVMVTNYSPAGPHWRIGLDDIKSNFVWEIKPDASKVPVKQGEWFKLEVYWLRSSGPDGRIWVAIDGNVVADQSGNNMGPSGTPINRVMVHQLYSGTSYPIYQWVDDLQIWSTFPTAQPGAPWYDPPYGSH
jgi:hypothetical protein